MRSGSGERRGGDGEPGGAGAESHEGHVDRRIVGFHTDDAGEPVAELECGHRQHVRHEPPWQVRPWVTTEDGRRSRLGTVLRCRACAGPA